MILGSLTLGERRGAYRLLPAADLAVVTPPAASSIRHVWPNAISAIRGDSTCPALAIANGLVLYVSDRTGVMAKRKRSKRTKRVNRTRKSLRVDSSLLTTLADWVGGAGLGFRFPERSVPG